jgi:P-type Ca2+ transporter type 2C
MNALPSNFDGIDRQPDPNAARGLTEGAAALRLRDEGFNELPTSKPSTIFDTAMQVLREPMFLLLIGTGLVYVLLGDAQEAAAMVIAVVVIIGITFYQERKTERALHALRDLSSPRALVIREGQRKRIPGRDVVRGDLVVLTEGDRIPADGVLLEANNLQVDESLLTGESVPVDKAQTAQMHAMGPPGGENSSYVFSGSLVVRGKGIAEIKATGIRTELGKIGKSLQALVPESTRLQRETSRVVRIFAVVGLALCLCVAVIYAHLHSNLLGGVLAGLTLAISMVPEEFPVVLTIFLAMGAWRISRQRVLTRRIPAIETLGSATVLCVDKTGTLTMNRMEVKALSADGETLFLDKLGSNPLSRFQSLIEYSILASSREPFDPMEKALIDLGEQSLGPAQQLYAERELIREYPLTPRLLAMSRAWTVPGANGAMIAAKGAPEAILELCHAAPSVSGAVLAPTQEMARRGLRVLGVAVGQVNSAALLPDDQRQIPFEFVGLVGLADPVRPSVPAAVKECYGAGVRVVMITGDYPITATNIAAQIGLRNGEQVITGAELNGLSDDDLRRRIETVNVFARVVPDQKLRLVKALQANGEVVAMTGDGVNDAPALKAADIGIAMGGRGTDVAREAAALVLLDDDFTSVVNAIRLGRRIYDNLKKATAYVLAVHVPIAGLTLIPVLLNMPLVLLPVHVLFLELIIDPTCSIAFESEPEEPNVMKRPPRSPDEKLFTFPRVAISLAQGLAVLVAVMTVYGLALHWGHDEFDSRAIAFSTLVVGNLALIFTNRSWSATIWETLSSRNKALWWVSAGAVSTLAATLYIPPLRALFHFSFLHPCDLAIVVAAGVAGVMWFEGMKLIIRWVRPSPENPV